MNIEMSNIGKKLTEKQLEKFEQKLMIKIPKDFKAFFLKYNGGFPYPDSFYCKNDIGQGINIIDNEESIDDFGVLKFLSLEEIEFEIKLSYFKNKDFLPIARDTSNASYVCIFVKGNRYGEIIFWALGGQVTENEDSNLYYLTDNFEEFISQLDD